jgi:hypothetical protein
MEDLPPVAAIEMPLQEIEVEAPIQALPTQLKQLESYEEVRPPTKIPEPLPARAIRQPKDIVITNPRKLGLRENFSTPPPKISHHEPDEITTVTARPIRIPIERTKLRRSQTVARTAIPNVSTDSSFFPALFGGSTAVASEERSSMFSGFYGETADRNSVVSQAIKIGGLVIAIASIVLIGKQFTGELRTEAAPVATNSARSVSDPAPQPIAEVQKETQRISLTTSVNSPPTAEKISTEPKPVKISTDTEPAKSRPSFSDDKTTSPADATRSKSSAEPRTSKPAKAEVAKTSTGSQPLTRTAKANPKPQALTRTTNKSIAQNKAGATTRPRIVANPRP